MKFRMFMKANTLILFMWFSTISTFTFGQEAEVDLFDLSLEELMEIDIYSASNANVDVQKVDVYTQKDFYEMGLFSTRDVLINITGMQISKNPVEQQNGEQQGYNDNVLLLIDNIPMSDGNNRNFDVDEIIPLPLVDKIEVTSGNSILNGTNSFSETINIISKSN
jgi:hypothetical protein